MSKKNSDDTRIWAIFSGEEKPIALAIAVTRGGALVKYEAGTGNSRHGLHVEEVSFKKGLFRFIASI